MSKLVRDAKVHEQAAQKTEEKRASIREVLQFADSKDYLLMAIGTLHAVAAGAGQPAIITLFGNMLDSIGDGGFSFMSLVKKVCVRMLYVGVGIFYALSVASFCWTHVGDSQALKIRELYIKSVLRQDIAWFDENKVTELPTKIISATAKIQEGLGKRIGDALMFFAQFIGLYVVGFWFSWKLALVIMCGLPLILSAVTFLQKVVKKKETCDDLNYAAAGGIATEVLSAMRTVASLNGEKREIARYTEFLEIAEKAGVAMSLQMGLGNAVMFAAMYCVYALGFWYGSSLVADAMQERCTGNDCISGGKVVSVFFAVLLGSMAIGQAAPSIDALGAALDAAGRVFGTIDRIPPIDAMSSEGATLDSVQGTLTFKSIEFSYPTRPDNRIYRGLDLEIAAGENVALVGPSGEGKSTLISLILRYYDPQGGAVVFDGVDIRTLNVQWYRAQLGYVGQEPVLFAGTIRQNIRNGKLLASDSEIEAAAEAANCHKFISGFPKGYDTEVGEAGVQISGGQKQRIAIARALVKQPMVLLLDEATSALDNESERVVQEALDKIQETARFTVIVIAHRLTTIQNCDKIAVISGGQIAELGPHKDLVTKPDGIYANLAAKGSMKKEDKKKEKRRPSDVAELKCMDVDDSSLMTEAPCSVPNETTPRSNHVHSREKEADLEKGKPKRSKVGLRRLIMLAKDRWPALALGLMGCLVVGGAFPTQGVLIARAQTLFYNPRARAVRKAGAKWAIAYGILAFVAFWGHIIRQVGLGIFGARMTVQIRRRCFAAIISKPIWWFDSEEHAPGTLVERLAADASKIQNLAGGALGSSVNLFCSLLVGLAISFWSSWQMALAVFAILPAFSVAGYIRTKMMTGTNVDKSNMDGGDEAGSAITSAIQGIRTVHAFAMQTTVSEYYGIALRKVQAKRDKKSIASGLINGYASAVGMVSFSFLFFIGATLIDKNKCNFEEMMTALFAMVSVAMNFGDSIMLAGDQKAANLAGQRIFDIIDDNNNSGVDVFSEAGPTLENAQGKLEFKNITFSYPARPDMLIYNNFNLNVPAGSTVALCGPSGGGKSTAMGLLLRFYLPTEGSILFDGKDIRELNVKWLRQQIGYVSQEPVLFSGSIRTNIKYGDENATEEEMFAAATSAKAHEFVMGFQKQYDTDVGEKSMLLSGGQKQRLAIARAILKNPKVLLLDEATSALDNENEKLVQEALDNMQSMQKRTTLVIAHRLSTIQNADSIAVIENGKVVELGTHSDLIQRNGLYARLSKAAQNR